MSNNEVNVTVRRSQPYTVALPGSSGRPTPGLQMAQLWPLPLILLAFPLLIDFKIDGSYLPLRILIAVTVFFTIYACRKTGLMPLMILIYLALLGGVRRNLIPFLGEESRDPLLIITPMIAVLYSLGVLFSRRVPYSNWFDKTRLILFLIMLAEIPNPRQGPLIVGVAGALFYVIPVLWSLLGREIRTMDSVEWMLYAIIALGTLGALYGIKQGIYGLTPAEQDWLTKSEYSSVYITATELRPFSFFTSTAEYASFLTLAIVVSWAMAVKGKWGAMLPFPLMAWGLFYTGIRTPIVTALAGCVLVWAVQGRTVKSWLPRAAVALVIGVAGLVYGLTHAQNSNSAIVTHQAAGLLNPTDSKASTVGAHAVLIEAGFTQSLRYPLGMGLGYTTLAAARFAGNGYNSEFDVSNMFISLGIPGGLVYSAFIVLTLALAFRVWYHRRTLTALCILAALSSHVGGWLNGGNYTIAMVLWFFIGALEREQSFIPVRAKAR